MSPHSRGRFSALWSVVISGAIAAGACTTMDRVSRMPPAATRAEPPPGIEQTALPVRERAPDFTLPSTTGEPVGLAQLLADGPAVLVFYRGDW